MNTTGTPVPGIGGSSGKVGEASLWPPCRGWGPWTGLPPTGDTGSTALPHQGSTSDDTRWRTSGALCGASQASSVVGLRPAASVPTAGTGPEDVGPVPTSAGDRRDE